MGFGTHTHTAPLLARLRSWNPSLPRDFESRRRLRASMMLVLAITVGILSSHSIEKQSVESYRHRTRPTLGQITPWMRHLGWRQIDPTQTPTAPPLGLPGSWWVEEGHGRIWYVESRTEAHLFESPNPQSPKKSSNAQLHLAGTGWEAIPALFSVLAGVPEPPSQHKPLGAKPSRRHSKEWQF